VPDLQAGAAARPAPDAALDHSYRALLRVPTLGRVLLAMQLARIGQAMVAIALVLFTLAEYGSPVLAGIVTFASTFPGVLMSPIAGALLDRHGRTRLVTLDYVVALVALVLLGVLALSGRLPAWLLVLIAAVASLTAILSATGLRSLFPIIVPRHLWGRVNAVDSNGYVVASIIGPPAAAALVTVVGGPATLICIGVVHGCAALAMRGIPDPETETVSSGNLLRDAWQGLVYAWRNPTLRGLGFAISTLNLAGGMTTIVIPLIVLDRLRAGEPVVGLVFALSGVAGMVSALIVGRLDTRGREWTLLVLPMLATAPILALLLPAAGADATTSAGLAMGLLLVATSMFLTGLLTGPLDVALFTVRQRRTDPAWMGRAFAVSMAFNFSGFPIGAALAGVLASRSIESAILVGVVASMLAAFLAAVMVPRQEPDAVASPVDRAAPPAGPGGP
jgi:MFS family permease